MDYSKCFEFSAPEIEINLVPFRISSAGLEKNPADPFLMRILLIDALTQYRLCRVGESQSGGKQVVMETPFKAPRDELAC